MVAYSWEFANRAGYSGPASGSDGAVAGGGSGFVTRPYFFQNDNAKLLASIAANDAEATGSAANNWGSPIGFITLATAAAGSAGRGSYPITGTYSDVYTRDIALAGVLTGNTTMMDVAKNEVMAFVAAVSGTDLSGSPFGDPFQHCDLVVGHIAIATDCCASRFTGGELATVATWINSAVVYVEDRNRTYWPGLYVPSGHEAVNNNYFQNQTIMWAMVALGSEGWNSQASTHRTHFEAIAENYIAYYNGGSHSLGYVGPQISEGRYYSSYIRNALWALRQYDAVMGTAYITRLGAAGPTYKNQLEMGLFHLLPRGARGFHDGSEPNNGAYAPSGTNISEYFQVMTGLADPSDTVTRAAKAILARSDYTGDSSVNAWARNDKAFCNFVFTHRAVTALPALSSYTNRYLSLPSPGGARDFILSSAGWDGATTTRKMEIFMSMVDFTSAPTGPGYGHSNVNVPGFQLAQGGDVIACDVEYGDTTSGVSEEGGSTIGVTWANCVGLASGNVGTGVPPSISWPIPLYREDNTGASVPHYYVSVNAQPMWSQCTTYRREYVVLDDMQVVVIFDRVVTAGSNNKTWRLHAIALPSIASGVATWTAGSTSCRVRDLYTTDGTAMTAADVTDAGSGSAVNRLSQGGTSNDWRSLKVLDLNSRCSAASLSSGSGYLQADMTINSVARSVRFFDDGSHATVS